MKERLMRFMQGRYGVDKFNQHILYLTIALLLTNIFLGKTYIAVLAYGFWFLSLYRMFSRQIYKRYAENEKYTQMIAPVTKWFSLQKRKMTDKEHKYFSCPNCKQTVRVPKGRGQIVVTCPKCHTKFDKKS